MATCQQSQNLAGSKFNCLNYILLYAERQTHFKPHEMDIERKLFGLAIRIWVGTLHQKLQEGNISVLRLKSAFIKAHLSNDSNSLCP